ncbi:MULTISPECIES: hypothetical protein [Halorussus]|uniref:hypothetical protein n=1 Tax=Halorussus TaxID=1070314 RepID=UPI00209CD743|nr:hypothetical protein [Halorussus vallis]USZ77545.1 hypothetical protein NGM07_09455 [Halorussus vallis]
MNRRWHFRGGVVLLLATAALVVVLGDGPVVEKFGHAGLPQVAQLSAMVAAGGLYVLGGSENSVSERAGWYRLVGLGDVLLGLSLPLGAVGGGFGGSNASAAVLVAMTGGGFSIAFVGVDRMRGGRHGEIEGAA